MKKQKKYPRNVSLRNKLVNEQITARREKIKENRNATGNINTKKSYVSVIAESLRYISLHFISIRFESIKFSVLSLSKFFPHFSQGFHRQLGYTLHFMDNEVRSEE